MQIDRQPKQTDRATPGVPKLPADQRGNLLVYLVVVILIFGVLGVSLVSFFTTATGSSATPNDAKRARFIAESGIRYALSEIRNSKDIEETATNLNTTAEFKLGTNGGFTANVFTPGLHAAHTRSLPSPIPYLTLNVPYSGKFPEAFDLHSAVSDLYIVDWVGFTGASHPTNSYAEILSVHSGGGAGASAVEFQVLDNFEAVVDNTVCFALEVTDGDTRIKRGDSLYVKRTARHFFPSANGAIRIVNLAAPNKQYDYFYEERIDDSANDRVELTNIREIPPEDWEDITNLQAGDMVTLSPFNFRLFASGTSDEITVEVGSKRPFWAMNMPGRRAITIDDVIADHNIVGEGDVFEPQAIGDTKIEVGKSNTGPGTEGFGDLWYSGTETIGGQKNFCSEGRCVFDKGVRVFFTAEFIPRSNGGEGLTFALTAAGETLAVPVNTKDSGGGDFQLPELLAYAGASLKSDASFADGSGDGLKPPKLALEFDTRTNFNTPLDYCTANNLNLIPGSRNDPLPGGTEKDVLQYVFWGSNDPTDLDLSCRSVAKESYDDNRHDAEGDQVAENFRYSVGASIRSEPTYDPTDGTVYFGSDDAGPASFWALNTDDGTLKWSFDSSGNVTSKPALDTIGVERFVYFSEGDDLFKMKADPPGLAGVKVWERQLNDFYDKVSPVVDNNNHKI